MRFLRIISISILLLLILTVSNCAAQILIGMKEDSVMNYMQMNMPDFNRNSGIINDRYNYLKYESDDGRQTMLVFFDKEGLCMEVRLNFDRSMYKSKISELDSLYRKSTENTWAGKTGEREFTIALSDETWYYTIEIREKEKQK